MFFFEGLKYCFKWILQNIAFNSTYAKILKWHNLAKGRVISFPFFILNLVIWRNSMVIYIQL